jgi:hypothetical protein
LENATKWRFTILERRTVMNTNEEVVKSFWTFFNEAKFDEAAELMEPRAIVRWCNTREAFYGRDHFILVNKKYPGRWGISIEKIV